MKLNLALLIIFSFLPVSAIAEKYNYAQENISFDFGSLINNQKSTRSTPLSIVFMAGNPPFSVSVFFKEEASNTPLENFISQEKENQEKGGYKTEIAMTNVSNTQYFAYEIIRNFAFGNIHWFVFQPKKSPSIYSFWLSERAGLKKENEQAIKNYNLMKKSLKITK